MSTKKSVFRRQPQQRRSQERVEQILKAAAEVFWDMGYDAATTHAIAQRAQTAVGTLYRFFPNKLAIFHALENQHRLGIDAIHVKLMTPEFMQQPLRGVIQQFVEIFAQYFEDPGPRVVFTQYFLAPEMFAYFDDSVTYEYARRFAGLLRIQNPALSVTKSELIAEVVVQAYNSVLLVALRSEPDHRNQLYQEVQDLLVNYLQPHMGDRHRLTEATVNPQLSTITQQYNLNSRQQLAVAHVLAAGSITIQAFESICPQRSRRTLQRDLKQMIEQGFLQGEGETNQLTYRLKQSD
ncbi:MAG: TetR/AcrR family transcriptional regulator [Cyanobacteria bacterium P01_F01_bin.86]